MSWLVRSIADSLRLDDDNNSDKDDDDEEDNVIQNPQKSQSTHRENEDNEEGLQEEHRAGRGVREDISEFTETLTRQLLGVASFLAPPPPPPPPSHHRIDRAVAEGDNWEHPNQSSHDVGSDMWKMDSNFPHVEAEDEIGGAVGITKEVLAFAMNIAHHPETWLDFPLEEEDYVDDFDMSNAQHEHVLAIQRLSPRLSALRIELCPAHMSSGYFWKVYFILLHSRLQKHDAELLSTPQIAEARATWMQKLQKRIKTDKSCFGTGISYAKESVNVWNHKWEDSFDNISFDDARGNMSVQNLDFVPVNYSMTAQFETEKHPVVSSEMGIVDKSVIEEDPVIKTRDVNYVAGRSFKVSVHNYDDEDEDDDWLKEDFELDGYRGTAIVFGDYDDLSFSDLEDDDGCTMPLKSK